jgi:hypothetical protein
VERAFGQPTDGGCRPAELCEGPAVGIQTADNEPATDVDLTIIFRDLTAAYAAALDTRCRYGTGSSGQVLGLDLTPGMSTIAVSEPTMR